MTSERGSRGSGATSPLLSARMREQRSRFIAHGTLLVLLVFVSCTGNDEAVGDRNRAGSAAICRDSCAGEAALAGSESGGSAPSGAGEGGTPQATAGKPPVGGGSGSSAGTDSTLGGESGSGGGPDGPILEELSLCDRLSMQSQLSTSFTKAFEKLVYADCRINWLNHLYLDFMPNKRDDYLNALVPWNLRFWGCQEQPVSDFALVFGTPPLSQGDADLVCDYYVQAAIEAFQLTKKEQSEMSTALAHLASALVTSSSADPSQPSCEDPNAGGAGGMSGVGGAAGSLPTTAGQGGGQLE
jgi:hypothetical protein